MKTGSLKIFAGVFLMILLWVVTGCVKSDLYDPNNGRDQLLPESEYFGFETRKNVKLSINYDTPGFQAGFKVYSEFPYNIVDGHYVKKEGVSSVYSANTDGNGKFEGVMYVPTSLKEAYLYTECWGMPQCVKLVFSNNTAVYDATGILTRAASALLSWFDGKKIPYRLNDVFNASYREDNMYSICKWGAKGIINDAAINPGYINQTNQFNESSTAEISARAQAYLGPLSTAEREKLICAPEVANVNITKDGTKLDVVFLREMALYKNSFGYYYYPTSTPPGNGEYGMSGDMKKLAKYVVFPNVSSDQDNNVLKCGNTVSLKFFKEDGTLTDEFPAGYTVGWFLATQSFVMPGEPGVENTLREGSMNGQNWGRYWGTVFTTNDEPNFRRFISLLDKKTGAVVIGVEDRIDNPDDYCDLTFFVKSNEDISNPGKPEIPDVDQEPELTTEVIQGTLAFEDVWPTGGDYDLNDVVVEYKRAITYDRANDATEIVETITPVHNGATFNNYFAFQIAYEGSITLPEGCSYESETKSIRIDNCVKGLKGQSFVIVRKFNEKEVNKDVLKTDFNPYIIVGDNFGLGRKEVHLPKHLATSLADDHLAYSEDDAYFIDKNGKYPFSLDLPILGFKVAAEKVRIDADSEYPAFKTWAESKGQQATEWYIKK